LSRRGAARIGALGALVVAAFALASGLRDTRAEESQQASYDLLPARTSYPVEVNLREIVRREAATPLRAEGTPRLVPLGRMEPAQPPVPPNPFFNPPAGPTPRISAGARAAGTLISGIDALPNQPFLPPDGGLAVGPNHIISAGNSAFSIINKSTGARISTTTYLSFFSGVDTTRNLFDPRAEWDPETGRFYMLIDGLNDPAETNLLLFAVSRTTDPTGSWFLYAFDTAEGSGASRAWSDYPTLGFNTEAFFTSGSLFQFSDGAFARTTLRILDKVRMLSGQPVTPVVLSNFNSANGGTFTLQPAVTYDPGQAVEWMTDVRSFSRVSLFQVTNALTAGRSITFQSFAMPSIVSPPGMAQSGSGLILDGGDQRMQMTFQRSGQLWSCSGIGDNSTGTNRGRARAFRWDINGSGVLAQTITLADPALNLHYPSIGMDAFGNVLMGMSCANSGINVSTGVSLKLTSDATFGPVTIVAAGTSGYNPGGGLNRWGDYSDTQHDPSNGAVIWTQHELATSLTQWKLRVSSIRTVSESIVVTAPNGGEVVQPGSPVNILWTQSGFGVPGNVRIELSRDGGVTFPDVIAASTPNNGSFTWTATGPNTLAAIVRVSSIEVPGIRDTSDAVFSITTGALVVVAPNGGEDLVIGRTTTLRWTASGLAFTNSPTVKIELSRDGGNNFETLFESVLNDGTQDWTIRGPGTTQALLKITTQGNPAFEGTSSEVFTIRSPSSIKVTAPAGGDVIANGLPFNVRWTSAGFSTPVAIDVSTDGGVNWSVVRASTANDGIEAITLTNVTTAAGRVRVRSLAEPDVLGVSPGVFAVADPSVRVTRPTGGQAAVIGLPLQVNWTSPGIGSSAAVTIRLSRDGGATFPERLASGVPNSGSAQVNLTGPEVGNAVVRVIWELNPTIFGDSSQFRIASPTLKVETPRAGSVWEVGNQEVATWSGTTVGIGTVTIQLSLDGGKTFRTLRDRTPNDGGEPLGIATAATNRGMLRIIWDLDTNVRGQSGVFRVVRGRRPRR
jgi:hypothetical protein